MINVLMKVMNVIGVCCNNAIIFGNAYNAFWNNFIE